MAGNSTGKVIIGVLVGGVVAAFSATAVYPLFIAERNPVPIASRTDHVPGGGGGGFERKSMWGNADAAAKGKAGRE